MPLLLPPPAAHLYPFAKLLIDFITQEINPLVSLFERCRQVISKNPGPTPTIFDDFDFTVEDEFGFLVGRDFRVFNPFEPGGEFLDNFLAALHRIAHSRNRQRKFPCQFCT